MAPVTGFAPVDPWDLSGLASRGVRSWKARRMLRQALEDVADEQLARLCELDGANQGITASAAVLGEWARVERWRRSG